MATGNAMEDGIAGRGDRDRDGRLFARRFRSGLQGEADSAAAGVDSDAGDPRLVLFGIAATATGMAAVTGIADRGGGGMVEQSGLRVGRLRAREGVAGRADSDHT